MGDSSSRVYPAGIQSSIEAENPGTSCAQALEQLKKKGRGFKMYKHFTNLSMAQRVKELGHVLLDEDFATLVHSKAQLLQGMAHTSSGQTPLHRGGSSSSYTNW